MRDSPELESKIQLDSYVGTGKSLGHQTKARTFARLAFWNTGPRQEEPPNCSVERRRNNFFMECCLFSKVEDM